MIRGSGVAVLTLLAALVPTGCAHRGVPSSGDPVEEARLRIAQVAEGDPRAVCAAGIVEDDRGLAALRSLGSEAPPADPGVRGGSFYFRSYEARQMNLSQASALMSGAYEQGKAAQAAVYEGRPGGHKMVQWAMAGFDSAYGAVTNPRPGRRSGPSRTETAFAAARYAMVWTEYLAAAPDAEGRDQLLDWLTTRSMDNLELLRAYHRDFDRALRRRCG